MLDDKRVLIVGCGRLGSQLANRLNREGCRITIVDKDDSAFTALEEEFQGIRLKGDALDESVMKEAHVREYDLAIAVTGKDDLNLILGLVARELFGVPRVIVRVRDPSRSDSLGGFKFITVCPTNLAADSIVNQVESALAGGDTRPFDNPAK